MTLHPGIRAAAARTVFGSSPSPRFPARPRAAGLAMAAIAMKAAIAMMAMIAMMATSAVSAMALPSARDDAPAAPLDARIAKAVEAGRKSLLIRLGQVLRDPPSDYPAGRVAFPAAALLLAGTPTDDATIRAAFERIAKIPPARTYCVASSLLALDALWKRMGEEGLVAPTAVRAEGEVRDRMAAQASWLAAAQNRSHGSWTYETSRGGSRHDFSNTQFAALGLEIAVEHGIPVPPEAFRALIDCFVRSIVRDPSPVTFELEREPALEELLRAPGARTGLPLRLRFRSVPGGWGYTDARLRTGDRKEPYPSMTAAGASSILIALRGLETLKRPRAAGQGAVPAQGPASREPSAAREASVAREASLAGLASAPPPTRAVLEAAYAWIAIHFDDYLAEGRNLPYTLYSIEKVGDLAALRAFGGRDWYREGATRLLELQRRDGSWGSYPDTALALLFLLRATRGLDAAPAPTIITGERGEAAEGGGAGGGDLGGGDLVYIHALGGFLSARELLRHAARTRSPGLVPAVEEAVRNYRPDATGDLVPPLVDLWAPPDRSRQRRLGVDGPGVDRPATDRLAAAARKALEEVTGLRSSRPEDYRKWARDLEDVRALERRVDGSADGADGARAVDEAAEIAALLVRLEGERLRARLAVLAGRRGLRQLAGVLVAEMREATPPYARTLHGVLSLWEEPPAPAPSGDDSSAWRSLAEAWRRKLEREGDISTP